VTAVDSRAVEDLVELRCPRDYPHPDGTCSAGRLLAQLRMAGEKPSFIHPDNLIVMACGDCKRFYRRNGMTYFRVLHCYDMAGDLVSTLFEEEDPRG
jgi:hypothetical protein